LKRKGGKVKGVSKRIKISDGKSKNIIIIIKKTK
jgi:hypothetical protein